MLQFTGIHIAVNETFDTLRRFPFYCVYEIGGEAATGLTFSAGDLKISKNGAAEVNHAGSASELAGGLYYYQATPAEVDTQGFFTFRMAKANIRPFVVLSEVGNLGRIGAPAGVSLAGDVANLLTRLGTPTLSSIAADLAALQADHPARITKNVAFNNFKFKMVLSSDHLSPATGLSVTAQRSLDGGAFAACANAPAEIAFGWYKINLAASDLNADAVALRFTANTADAQEFFLITQPT